VSRCRGVAHDAARMALDDGLLPPWLVYHELVENPRPTLRRVTAVEHAWVAPALEKLQSMDAARLARAGPDAQPVASDEVGTVAGVGTAPKNARDESKINAARERAKTRREAERVKKMHRA
jgi:ATP-dependent RNA helicase DHX8/PRP22